MAGRWVRSNNVIVSLRYDSRDIMNTIGREEVTAGNFFGPTTNVVMCMSN